MGSKVIVLPLAEYIFSRGIYFLAYLPQNPDNLTLYHTYPIEFEQVLLLLVNVSKIDVRMANSVDPDQMPECAASDLGLRCLLMPVCPSTYDKYGISEEISALVTHCDRDDLLIELDFVCRL